VGDNVTVFHRIVVTDGSLWTAGPPESLTLTRGTVTADEDEVDLPTEFALKGNYPNPFNPSTTIQFDLPETADVTITVTDMLGRQVLSVPSASFGAGANMSVQVDASSLASGLYLYRVIARGATATYAKVGTMTLIK
jgi:Secretion system C-terminal sorting domain